jgi:putative colanic acid biosynthesis acetyltransferase WcaF
MLMKVDLSKFSTGEFERGAGTLKEALWLVVSRVLFQWCPFCLSPLKRGVLRLFGASVGKGVVIKPEVKITFPWKLTLGDHVWLGEECWLLNLAPITIASNVCISQRAFLCTGNHDYKSPTFDLITEPIQVGEGAWVGAGAFVGPGVSIGSHAVLAAGSVATRDLEAYGIHQGNPAERVKARSLGTEDGRRRTEDGRPRTEDGRPRTEDGRPRTEDGRPRTEG